MTLTENQWPALPSCVAQHFVERPVHLLSIHEQGGLSSDEKTALNQGLRPVPQDVLPFAPWLGALSLDSSDPSALNPRTVATGICLPEYDKRHHWETWRRRGPTLEYVWALKITAEMCKFYQAEMCILIGDQEFLRDVYRQGTEGEFSDAQLLINSLHQWINRAYPRARTLRSADMNFRGEITAMTDEARLFPSGVSRPWGRNSRDFWTQFDFLTNVALFASLAKEKPALLLLDHDQIRPAVAARRITNKHLHIFLYWPVPAGDWVGLSDDRLRIKNGPVDLSHVHRKPWVLDMLDHPNNSRRISPRRMHRSPAGRGWLYQDITDSEIELVATQTLREIGRYLKPSQTMPDVRDLAITELRSRLAAFSGPIITKL